ncbi:hypothetical protein BWI17_07025 [Betaproteobacteria bacterium GR16-43]|nr:hypothetical protein BWI17_07025 [Betaproteobacteria bacterium GR16-43]
MNLRIAPLVLSFLLAACGGGGGGSSAPTVPPVTVPPYVSAPDCSPTTNLISEAADAPKNITFMRVQHMGDLGTAELAGQISNVITWPVGDYTGFYPPDAVATGAQRGYRDAPPPVASSAFQFLCGGAGFLINTFQFNHTLPLTGEGPSVSVAREPSPQPVVFSGPGATLTIEAMVNLKHAAYQGPHTVEGTAQLSFFYSVRDVTTNTDLGHIIQFFDSRPIGVGGTGSETIGSDGVIAFASSPMLARDSAGAPVRYIVVGPGSDTMHTVDAWNRPILFRAQVPYENFRQMLLRMKSGPLPNISTRPEDYRVPLFGVLVEVFPGTGSDHNVTFGGSVTDMRLSGG